MALAGGRSVLKLVWPPSDIREASSSFSQSHPCRSLLPKPRPANPVQAWTSEVLLSFTLTNLRVIVLLSCIDTSYFCWCLFCAPMYCRIHCSTGREQEVSAFHILEIKLKFLLSCSFCCLNSLFLNWWFSLVCKKWLKGSPHKAVLVAEKLTWYGCIIL